MTGYNIQNISTVLIKVHPLAESQGPGLKTTGMAAVSILVSTEATQLKFEVQILSKKEHRQYPLTDVCVEEIHRKLVLSSGTMDQRQVV